MSDWVTQNNIKIYIISEKKKYKNTELSWNDLSHMNHDGLLYFKIDIAVLSY
jgi:hypothetical protein